MPQKTIYLPASALGVWEQAQRELGQSISALVVDCLTRKLERKRGYDAWTPPRLDEISILVNRDDRLTKTLRFKGYWLFEKLIPTDDGRLRKNDVQSCSVARTGKGQFLVYWELKDKEGGSYFVYENFDRFFHSQFEGRREVPINILKAATQAMDEESEEILDI